MIRPDFTGDVPFSIWSMARFEGDAEGAGSGGGLGGYAGLGGFDASSYGGKSSGGSVGNSSGSFGGSVGGSVGGGGKSGASSGGSVGGSVGGSSSSGGKGGSASGSASGGTGGSASAGGSVGGGNFGGSGNDFGGLFGGAATNGMFGGGSTAGNSAAGSVGGSLGGPGSAVGSGLGALSGISSIGAGLYSGIGYTTPSGFSMPNSISTPYSSIGKHAPSARAAENQSMAAYNAFSTSARSAEDESMGKWADVQAWGKEVKGVVAAGPGWTTVELNDGTVETRSGQRGSRNNNPGNIEYGSFAKSKGAIGTDGRFAVFSSYEQGKQAIADLLGTKSYAGKTVAGAISTYAPPSENNTKSYASTVASKIGVSVDTKMADLSPAQKSAMVDAMIGVEGSKGYTSKTDKAGNVVAAMSLGLGPTDYASVSGSSTSGKSSGGKGSASGSSQVSGSQISPATVGHMAAMGGNTSPQGTKSAAASTGLTTATPASAMPSSITGAANASHRAAEDISMAAYNSIPDEAKSYLSKWGPGPDATVAGYDISNNASTISAPSPEESHFADTYLGGNDEGKTGVAADDSADEAPATTAEATPSQTAETGKTDKADEAGKTDASKSKDESKPSIGKQIAGTVIDIGLGMIPGVGVAATGFNVLSAISGKPSIGQTIAGGLFNGAGNYTGQPATDFGHGDGGGSIYIPSTLSDSQSGANDNGYVDFVTKYLEFDDGIDRPTPAEKWDRNRRKYGRLAYG